MSELETLSPLATVTSVKPIGMISLRATFDGHLEQIVQSLGFGLPAQRQIIGYANGQVAWMSPDELLLLMPRDTADGHLHALRSGLSGTHHLVTDVSDMRAMFRVEGEHSAQVLAKLSPVDLLGDAFSVGEIRRTRLAQVPAAFWRDANGFTLICFRSVAVYVRDLLDTASKPGTGL